MSWQRVETIALDIDTGVSRARADAIAEALSKRAVPLLVRRDGRAEPLASGALYTAGRQLVLVTCRHVFDDGVTLGDLGVPLAHGGPVLWLRDARVRLLSHPLRDLAAIAIASTRAMRESMRHWHAQPLEELISDNDANIFVLAGYPYAQMRRVDAVMHARPVVVFARAFAAPPGELRLVYARTARRVDGLLVHAPALDGVSGATMWAVHENEHGCVLQPAAIQCAFKHDAYLRGEPMFAFGAHVAAILREGRQCA